MFNGFPVDDQSWLEADKINQIGDAIAERTFGLPGFDSKFEWTHIERGKEVQAARFWSTFQSVAGDSLARRYIDPEQIVAEDDAFTRQLGSRVPNHFALAGLHENGFRRFRPREIRDFGDGFGLRAATQWWLEDPTEGVVVQQVDTFGRRRTFVGERFRGRLRWSFVFRNAPAPTWPMVGWRATRIDEEQRRIYEYDGSDWVVSEDQDTPEDTIETRGECQPGDYLGPWILNDIHAVVIETGNWWVGITPQTSEFQRRSGFDPETGLRIDVYGATLGSGFDRDTVEGGVLLRSTGGLQDLQWGAAYDFILSNARSVAGGLELRPYNAGSLLFARVDGGFPGQPLAERVYNGRLEFQFSATEFWFDLRDTPLPAMDWVLVGTSRVHEAIDPGAVEVFEVLSTEISTHGNNFPGRIGRSDNLIQTFIPGPPPMLDVDPPTPDVDIRLGQFEENASSRFENEPQFFGTARTVRGTLFLARPEVTFA